MVDLNYDSKVSFQKFKVSDKRRRVIPTLLQHVAFSVSLEAISILFSLLIKFSELETESLVSIRFRKLLNLRHQDRMAGERLPPPKEAILC